MADTAEVWPQMPVRYPLYWLPRISAGRRQARSSTLALIGPQTLNDQALLAGPATDRGVTLAEFEEHLRTRLVPLEGVRAAGEDLAVLGVAVVRRGSRLN